MIKIPLTLENQDWLRTLSWDLPDDPDEFVHFLEERSMTLKDFIQLPAAVKMPTALKRELLKRGVK
jgi:hypothetical protein